METSEIVHYDGGTTLAGKDATALFAAAVLKASIATYAKCGMIPTRGVTISGMLKRAMQTTGHKYKNNAAGWAEAVKDLDDWIQTMRAALPISDERLKGPNEPCYYTGDNVLIERDGKTERCTIHCYTGGNPFVQVNEYPGELIQRSRLRARGEGA